MESTVWIPMTAALLGAAVGGVASLGGSIVVDRMRLRRETRIRVYDVYLPTATAAVDRWRARSERGSIDMENEQALTALAQVRRGAVIAGRRDQRQLKRWGEAAQALGGLSVKISDGSCGRPIDERNTAAAEAASHTSTVLEGLMAYSTWLEKRL